MKETISALKMKVVKLMAEKRECAAAIMKMSVRLEKANEDLKQEQELNAQLMERITELEEK